MNNDIGSLIVSSRDIRHGRPCITGTGITVHRIAIWYKLGHSPEEIARRYGHLSEAQVYAALAYYHANRDQIEAELAEEEAEADAIERQHMKDRQTACSSLG
jgi:uncharacterized protein (DUF433 family)